MLINFSQLKQKYNMDISSIIHIGGHFGEEIDEYVKNGITNIHIFEPINSNCEIIKQKIKNLNKDIFLYEYALGNDDKDVDMFISSNNKESSSILKPNIHLSQYPHIIFNTKETVKMKKLDNFNIVADFINMDVQGYELEVLKGSQETLKNVKYIYCEVNNDYVYENNVLITELDTYLKNFSRVETDWSGKTWGDALYIKK